MEGLGNNHSKHEHFFAHKMHPELAFTSVMGHIFKEVCNPMQNSSNLYGIYFSCLLIQVTSMFKVSNDVSFFILMCHIRCQILKYAHQLMHIFFVSNAKSLQKLCQKYALPLSPPLGSHDSPKIDIHTCSDDSVEKRGSRV